MLKKILLDGREFHFTQSDLPILIHGAEHTGTSLFTISVLADFYSQSTKVVALTGYVMAGEEFENQTESRENAHFFIKEKKDEFIDFITRTSDINDYVVLIKNVELLDKEVFDSVKNLKNSIFSGDINKCSFKKELQEQSFSTKIYFSSLEEPVELPKYQGLFVSEKHSGEVSVEV